MARKIRNLVLVYSIPLSFFHGFHFTYFFFLFAVFIYIFPVCLIIPFYFHCQFFFFIHVLSFLSIYFSDLLIFSLVYFSFICSYVFCHYFSVSLSPFLIFLLSVRTFFIFFTVFRLTPLCIASFSFPYSSLSLVLSTVFISIFTFTIHYSSDALIRLCLSIRFFIYSLYFSLRFSQFFIVTSFVHFLRSLSYSAMATRFSNSKGKRHLLSTALVFPAFHTVTLSIDKGLKRKTIQGITILSPSLSKTFQRSRFFHSSRPAT